MKAICVFCGSSPGRKAIYAKFAKRTGELFAEKGIQLVYGAGSVGLMGIMADACMAAGGHVVGVIPKHLVDLEVCHHGIQDLRVVDSMQERKQLMLSLADGFLSLPGGIGTIDEMFEVLTLNQLDIHQKPCGLLNIDGYYDHLLYFLEKMIEERFLLEVHRNLLLVNDDPELLLDQFYNYKHIGPTKKWLDQHINPEF